MLENNAMFDPEMAERARLPQGATLSTQASLQAAQQLLDPSKPLANVVGFGHGVKWRNNQPTGQEALIVFVEQKLPGDLLPEADMVPDEVAGLPTDVVATGAFTAEQLRSEQLAADLRDILTDGGPAASPEQLRTPQRAVLRFMDRQVDGHGLPAGQQTLEVDVQVLRNRVRPVKGGYSIGHFRITAGTMATAVYDLLPGATVNPPASGIGIPPKFYALSNNHVLANSNNALVGDPILQPGPFDGGVDPQDRVARLSRFVTITFDPPVPRNLHQNLVDAAIAEGEFSDLDREIYWQGYVRGWYPAARLAVGDRVKKTGRTTNATYGRVIATNATVDVNYGGNPARVARFVRQIVSTNMSAGGDSGSLLLSVREGSQANTEDNYAVGLLFAGSSQATIFNHIEFVRALLRVEVAP
jgi:hypothetical protein